MAKGEPQLIQTEIEEPKELLEESFAVLSEAYDTHKPRASFALFSGGHDSLTATAVAFEWAERAGVELKAAHINTGTGVPQTSEFVREVCRDQGWELLEFSPPVPYEEIVMEYGFPGPAQHGLMYQRLKERCLRQLVRQHKQEMKDRIMLVTGVRSEESVRRMRHVERIQREGAQVWAADIWNWTKRDCNRELERRGLPRNPVVDLIHMSGECLCGAFARPGELKELEMWFPEVAERIKALQIKVEAAGLRGCVWGQRPPRVHRDQMKLLFGEAWDDADTGPLCSTCVASTPDFELDDEQAEAA
jgi:3'-phosphoadenosine 5'-phosphosulfate sulfotransferase (PAPS reductase)/FAD synthetase